MTNEIDKTSGLMGLVVRGGKWLSLSEFTVNGMLVVRLVILLPFFVPEDWGLWAAVFTTLQFLRILSDTGINMVTIQHRRGESPEVLITTWWLNCLRGVVLGALLLLLAPVIATCFTGSGPVLVSLLRLVAVVFLMEGFSSAGLIVAERRLAFDRLVLVQQGSTVVSIVSAVVLGVVLRNVQALVIAEIVRATLLLVLSYVVLPVRPSTAGSFRAAGELLKRGWHLYVAKVCDFLILRGGVFVVGWVWGTAKLGLYHLALNCGLLGSAFVLGVLSRVIFPAFARMQDDLARLKQAVLRVQRFALTVVVPLSLGIVALAPVVEALGGMHRTGGAVDDSLKYAGLAFPMQMFALAMIVSAVSAVNFSALLGLGHFAVIRRLRLLHLALFAAAIYPLTKRFGVSGAVMVAFLDVPMWVVVARINRRTFQCGMTEQLRNLLFILAPAAAMTLTMGLLWHLLGTRIVVYAVGVAVLCPTTFLLALWLGAPARARESLDVLRQAVGGADDV